MVTEAAVAKAIASADAHVAKCKQGLIKALWAVSEAAVAAADDLECGAVDNAGLNYSKVVEASGDDRDKLEQDEQKLRGMAKDYSLEWLDYARASGQDTQKAMTLCVTASGSKKFCKE